MYLRREQSDPCQLRSQVHMSLAPHTPCPEHALGHSAWDNAKLEDNTIEVSTFFETLIVL